MTSHIADENAEAQRHRTIAGLKRKGAKAQSHRKASQVVWGSESATVSNRRHRGIARPLQESVLVTAGRSHGPLCPWHSGSALAMLERKILIVLEGKIAKLSVVPQWAGAFVAPASRRRWDVDRTRIQYACIKVCGAGGTPALQRTERHCGGGWTCAPAVTLSEGVRRPSRAVPTSSESDVGSVPRGYDDRDSCSVAPNFGGFFDSLRSLRMTGIGCAPSFDE